MHMKHRTGRPPLSKVKVNLALGPQLATASKLHAEEAEMSLSELVAYLLRRELAQPTATPTSQRSVRPKQQ
jgi:hypothetical protein